MASQKARTLALLILGCLGGALACQGSIVGKNGGSRGNGGPGSADDPTVDPSDGTKPTPDGTKPTPDQTKPLPMGTMITPETPADPEAAGPNPLRRLTRREYNNTVRDLLGDTTHPADAFPPDRDEGFLFPRAGLVSAQDLSTLRDAAEALGAMAAKDATLTACTGAEMGCATKFISNFGLRAYRRPLTSEESARLLALYQNGRTAFMLDHAGAVGLLVEAMLQSPSFLYHQEAGVEAPAVEGKVIRLGSYEAASRLSYFLWGSMPDGTLFDAAAGGHLATDAEIEAQARRMLGDKRARDTINAFMDDWLNLDQVSDRPKDPAAYPEFNDALKAAMIGESRAFATNVVFDGDGRFASLFTARNSFVNQALANVYKVNAQGAELAPVMLDGAERSGLLTRAAFLTVTGSTNGSHPVKRGRKVYERILCGELPPPPPNVPPPKPASEGGTTRARFAEHGQMKCAVGCHGIMDPIGFGFEHYDGIGKYRTVDNKEPVDSASTMTLDGKQQAFADARELSQLLAGSTEARRCMVTQWVRFAFDRLETQGDIASVKAAAAAFAQHDYDIRDLLVGVVKSRSFRYRAPNIGEL